MWSKYGNIQYGSHCEVLKYCELGICLTSIGILLYVQLQTIEWFICYLQDLHIEDREGVNLTLEHFELLHKIQDGRHRLSVQYNFLTNQPISMCNTSFPYDIDMPHPFMRSDLCFVIKLWQYPIWLPLWDSEIL